MGDRIQLTAADGHRFGAYYADPPSSPRGGLLVIHEVYGVNDHIRQVTDGFAAAGYRAIAPALFDRVERDVDLGYSQEDRVKARELRLKAELAPSMMDVKATIEAVASSGKVGIVGYCWGGYIAWMASGQVAGLTCAVPYYPIGILDHADLEPKIPLLAHFAERDAMIPIEGVRQLATKHERHQFLIYAAEHGFNCDGRGAYDAEAAKLARERTLAFLREQLG